MLVGEARFEQMRLHAISLVSSGTLRQFVVMLSLLFVVHITQE